MMKVLMDCCMASEKLVDHLKERAEVTETERNELKVSCQVQIKILIVMRKALEELETQAEALKKVLNDKDGEISLLRKQVRQAKEDRETEFCNSDGFLTELGGYYANSFNECLHQVKALFPNLDVSQVSLDDVVQTSARSDDFEGTDELFKDDLTPDAHGDGGAAPQDEQAKFVGNESHQVEEAKLSKKVVDKKATVDQPQFLQTLYFFYSIVEIILRTMVV